MGSIERKQRLDYRNPMGYKVDYIVPQRVMVTYLYGYIEADDYNAIQERSFGLMDAGVAPIHTISVVDPHIRYARDLKTLVSMMKGLDRLHEKAGWLIQVSDNSMHRFISAWALQVVYKNMRFNTLDSFEAALRFLHDRDSTLADMDIPALLADYAAWKPVVDERS